MNANTKREVLVQAAESVAVAKDVTESFDFGQDKVCALSLVQAVGNSVGAIQRAIGHEIALCVTFLQLTANGAKAIAKSDSKRADIKKARKLFVTSRLAVLGNDWQNAEYASAFDSLVWKQTTKDGEPAETVEVGPFVFSRSASETWVHVAQSAYSRTMWNGWLNWYLTKPKQAMEAVASPDTLGQAVQKILNGINAEKAKERAAESASETGETGEAEAGTLEAVDTSEMPVLQAEAVNMAQGLVLLLAQAESKPDAFFDLAKSCMREVIKTLHDATL